MHMTRRSLLKGSALLAASASGAQTTSALSLEGLKGKPASLVADALRKGGLDPHRLTMSTDIRPVAGHTGPIAGPAVTTKWELTREGQEGMSSAAIRRFVFEPVDDAPAGSIWIIESGTERLLSMFGDVIGLACQRKGMAGAITDSGCRDVAAMESYGFPVFAKGTVLYGPGDAIRPVAANVPIVCGGVDVRPGDVVVADVDGVIVVPQDALAEVARAADELQKHEDDTRQKIEAGIPLAEAYTL